MIAYAAVTNILLMTIYSMNNMPYSALGGVMTGDVNERAKLNSFRFISVNAAQFIVGGLTLPLVAKFAVGSDRQHGWQAALAGHVRGCAHARPPVRTPVGRAPAPQTRRRCRSRD